MAQSHHMIMQARRTIVYPLFLLVAFLLSSCGGAKGPSEAEVRQAVQDRLNNINSNVAAMSSTPIREGDPMSAMSRLMGAVVGDLQVNIAEFKLLGTQKAHDRPGWVCTYYCRLEMSGGNSPAAFNFLNSIGGENVTANFIQSDDGNWIMLPPEE